MKNYNDEKIIFDKFTAFFNIAIFGSLLIYNNGWWFIVCEISTSPRAFSFSFQYFADMFHTY